jgi:hypothetical protein
MELAGAPAEWQALRDLGEHILGGLGEHHLREATTLLASRMAGVSTCGWHAWIWKEGHVIGTCLRVSISTCHPLVKFALVYVHRIEILVLLLAPNKIKERVLGNRFKRCTGMLHRKLTSIEGPNLN